MKSSILAVLLFTGTGFAYAATNAGDMTLSDPEMLAELREQTFNPLFNALQTGDLVALKGLLPRDLYREYQKLFEQNAQYGAYLRNYYQGASFQLIDATKQQDGYLGQVEIYWPDGHSVVVDLLASDKPGSNQKRVVGPTSHRN